MTFGESPEVNEGLQYSGKNNYKWWSMGDFPYIYILYYIIWDCIRLYKRFPQKWEHHFPMTGTFPPKPGSGMHTWTGATVAPRHDEMTNGMNVEWEILQEDIGKTWKNHGENQGFLKIFTWIKPFIATKSQEMLGFVRVTKFDNKHGKQWDKPTKHITLVCNQQTIETWGNDPHYGTYMFGKM